MSGKGATVTTGERRGQRHPLSVAPMMDWTDRHCRFFLRLISRRTLLYTELVTTGSVLRGDRERMLGFSSEERPLAVQLGGDDPQALADCARIAEGFGYDEVNLNVGCPSARVRLGRFGACLMAHPALVAESVAAMRAATRLPVTVKHRLGITGRESYADLVDFVRTVADAGCDRFVVHARLADLERLSPKQNRRVPKLRHEVVHQLKDDLSGLWIELNGNIRFPEEAEPHLEHLDGVMIGRAAYANPYALHTADALLYDDPRPPRSREAVVEALIPYMERWTADGRPLHRITRHVLGLFRGQAGARIWRRHLSEHVRGDVTDVGIVRRGLDLVREAQKALGR